MIVAILFIVASSLLSLFAALMSGLNFLIPQAISNGITYVFSGIGYFQGIFPVDQLVLAFSLLLKLLILKYLVKWLFVGLNMIPGVNIQFPRFFGHNQDTGQVAINEHFRFKKMMSGRDKINMH